MVGGDPEPLRAFHRRVSVEGYLKRSGLLDAGGLGPVQGNRPLTNGVIIAGAEGNRRQGGKLSAARIYAKAQAAGRDPARQFGLDFYGVDGVGVRGLLQGGLRAVYEPEGYPARLRLRGQAGNHRGKRSRQNERQRSIRQPGQEGSRSHNASLGCPPHRGGRQVRYGVERFRRKSGCRED